MPTSATGIWAVARVRSRSRRAGLTLLELMVTMALIAVMSTMVAPSLNSLLASSRLKAATRAVLVQTRYARDIAVRKQTYARLVIDDVARTSEVLVLIPAEAGGQGHWESATETIGRLRPLPDSVEFDRLITSDRDGEPQVTFSPDGRGQEFYVALVDKDQRKLALRVDGVTGITEILSAEAAAERELQGHEA